MKKVIIAAALLFSTLNFVSAQTVKLGHINAADLLQSMPEVKAADSTLQNYQKSLQDQYNSMLAEYKTKTDEYAKDGPGMTDAVKEVKEQEISDLQNRIQTFQQSAQDKLSNKKEEIYTPILKKAQDAIKAVGKANGYAYVFDTSPGGSVVYYEDTDDLLPLVKKQLNLK